jgi:hypothetical protein
MMLLKKKLPAQYPRGQEANIMNIEPGEIQVFRWGCDEHRNDYHVTEDEARSRQHGMKVLKR